jgi:hypothetical protein
MFERFKRTGDHGDTAVADRPARDTDGTSERTAAAERGAPPTTGLVFARADSPDSETCGAPSSRRAAP